MMQVTATYAQMLAAKSVFGPKLQTLYTPVPFRAVIVSEGLPFAFVFDSVDGEPPATFLVDFPTAILVDSITF